MKLKKLFTATIAALMITGSAMTAMAGQWIANGNAWYYLKSNGQFAANQWVGNYYLGADGHMLTNTWTPDGYFVGADGKWIPNALNADTSSSISVIGTYTWTYTEPNNGAAAMPATFVDTREVSANSDKSLTIIERANGMGGTTSQVSFMGTNHYVSVINGLQYDFNNGEMIITNVDGTKMHFTKTA
ncbi:MAG: hypothetical protein K6A76_11475 [Oribacterium sp.]|nr:hypothetical protein [Oribacterium sp.]